MEINVSKQTRYMKLTNRRLFYKILRTAGEVSGLKGLVPANAILNIIILNDAKMTELNEQFLQHEGTTDVITFDWMHQVEEETSFEEEGDCFDSIEIGEIYVSINFAEAAAKEFNTSLAYELILYCVHGMLHLCGYDDHCDEDIVEMRANEKRVMTALQEFYKLEEIFQEK